MTPNRQTPRKSWKSARVFVENAPDQWHVLTGEWGAPSIAVVDTPEHAALFALAPELLDLARLVVDTIPEPDRIDNPPPGLIALRNLALALIERTTPQ